MTESSTLLINLLNIFFREGKTPPGSVMPSDLAIQWLTIANATQYLESHDDWHLVAKHPHEKRFHLYLGPGDAAGEPLEIVLPVKENAPDGQVYLTSAVNLLASLAEVSPYHMIIDMMRPLPEAMDNESRTLECPNCGTMNSETAYESLLFTCANCQTTYNWSVCQSCEGIYGLIFFPKLDICPHCGHSH